MSQPRSRYEQAIRALAPSRAAKLLTQAAVGVVLTLPVACGNNDAAFFENNATPTSTDQSAQAPADIAQAEPGPTDSVASDLLSTQAELLVSFTYEASSTDRTKRPYIAVWLEDSNGELVDTISLWYDQGGKGQKWLDDLRQWHAVGGSSDTTMSGATRVAGEYIVSWDGTDATGNAIPQGEYVLYIEAAREHGPYSLTSADISIGEEAFVIAVADNEELSNISTQLLL